MKKKIIAIVGKTSSGKDTVCKYLWEKYRIPMIVSYTTRPMRDYEVEGVQHYFVSEEEMNKLEKQNDILAYTRFPKTGYRYCATVSSMKDDIMAYIINPDGVNYLKKNIDKLGVECHTLYLHLPEEIIRERAIGRGDNLDLIEERLASETKQFDEFYASKRYDFCIDTRKELEDVFSDVDTALAGILTNSDV